MTQYDNTNRGALFRNDRRESDNHPTHSGSINIEGREYWLSAWVREGQKGKYFSLSVKPKDGQQAARPQRTEQSGAGPAPLDDDIPFAMEWR